MRIEPAHEHDHAAIDAYLRGRPDTTMFLRSNLRHGGLAFTGARYQGQYTLAWDGAALAGIAGHAWNGMVMLQADSPALAAELTAATIARSGRAVTGFTGALDDVRAARAALRLDAAPTRLDVAETLMALALDALVVPPALADGRVRVRRIRATDQEPLIAWRVTYELEANAATPGPDNDAHARRWFDDAVAEDNAWIAELGDTPVAMTSFNARLPDAVQVGGVYTPAPLRGRHHARAALAGSLLDMRAAGVRRAVLFTGAPDAEAAYRAVGFEIVGSYGIVLFA